MLELDELTRAFESAREKGLSITALRRILERHKGERGTARLRTLVERHSSDRGFARGGYEDAFYAWLLTILPPGVELRIIVELNYFGHHGASRVQTTRDTQIARDLRGLGWQVETLTSDEFEDDLPLVERAVRQVLGI